MYIKAFDAKSRGRSVHLVFDAKDAKRRKKTQKDARRKKNKKLYYINGGTQERKFSFINRFFLFYISMGVHRNENLVL